MNPLGGARGADFGDLVPSFAVLLDELVRQGQEEVGRAACRPRAVGAMSAAVAALRCAVRAVLR
jgi:hypothetical protein